MSKSVHNEIRRTSTAAPAGNSARRLVAKLYMPMAAPLQTLSTAPYHGYQVLFSPFSPKLAFTGAQNYGIAGKLNTAVMPRPHFRLQTV